MKNKKPRKLVVNTKAIRPLGEKELRRVAGGFHISTYCSGSSTATCTNECADMNTTYTG